MKLFWILFIFIQLCFSQSDDPETVTSGAASSGEQGVDTVTSGAASSGEQGVDTVTSGAASSGEPGVEEETPEVVSSGNTGNEEGDVVQPETGSNTAGDAEPAAGCKTSIGGNCISCETGKFLKRVVENDVVKIVCEDPDFTQGNCSDSDKNICYSCSQGRLVDNKCEACPPGCTKCDTNVCITCDEGLSLSLDQTKCVNCALSENDEDCGRCGTGKYFDLEERACVDCKQHCNLCTSSEDCYECSNEHYLENNECKPIEHCDVKKSDHCEVCEEGFRLTAGHCVSCNVNGIENCTACTETKCIQCNEDSILSAEGKCVYAEDADTDLNCAQGSSTYGCTQCLDGYYFDENMKCQPCDTSCKTCIGTATTCLSCKDNYFFSETGLTCVAKQEDCAYADQFGCKECTYDITSQNPGKLVVSGQKECSSCDATCKTCQGLTGNCTSCFKNKVLDCTTTSDGYRTCVCSELTAEKVTSSHCMRSEMGYCVQCEDGYYVGGETESTRQCVKCHASCYTCNDAETCLICSEGFYRDPATGKCQKTDDLKSICVVGQHGCLSCLGKYFMNTSQSTPFCQECPPECKACEYDSKENKAYCTICNSANEYVKNRECKPCSEMSHCLEAVGEKCTVCESGYTLDPGAKSCSKTQWAVIIPVCIVICIVIIIIVVLVMIIIWWRRQKTIKKKQEAMKKEKVTTDMAVILESKGDDDFPLVLETKDLTFNLDGSHAVVDSLYEQKVNIQNSSKKDQWFEILMEKSHKYELTVTPPTCLLKPGSSMDIDFKLRMLCTTEIDEYIGIVSLDVDEQQKFTAKFNLKVKSDQSHRLDYKEVKPIMPSIGETLSGILYRGTYQGKDVCIHKLRIKKFTEIQEKLFEKEITMMSELKDEHIVPLIGAIYTPGEIAIVTEYPEYNSLNTLWGKQHVLYATKIKIMKEVAKGLSYLHKNQILHRDICSTNIHVFSINPEEDICAKLGGLKHAKNMKESKEMSKGIGSPIYMAPEVIKNDGKYSYPSDVYSFAILMYETFVESSPYESDPRFTQEWMIPQFVLNGNRLDKHRQMPDNYWNLIMSSWVENANDRPEFNTIISTIEGWGEVDDIVLEEHEVESGDHYGVASDGHATDEKVHSDSSSGSDYDTSNSSSSSSE